MSLLDYDHNASRASLQLTQQRRIDSAQEPRAFGSTKTRFDLDELVPTPGVGSYVIERENSMVIDSPSRSKRGAYTSKSMRLMPQPINKNPGPGHYNLPNLGHLEPWQRRPSTAFIASGKGRVPFPEPNNNPGPADYRINFNPGESPILRKKSSATFASKSGRDSFFDAVSNKNWSTTTTATTTATAGGGGNSSPSGIHDVQWHKSTLVRMQQIGHDNKVPGCERYFDDRVSYQKDTSLRSCGRYNTCKMKGKQNEKPAVAMHTFGADKDRFKDSIFGRLDLKALIPAPGSYDDIFRSAKQRAKSLRVVTAASPTRARSISPDALHTDSRYTTKEAVHNFGADPDRFNKRSFYGRLDLKAEIPGPGSYDDIFRSTRERMSSPHASAALQWSPTNSPGVRSTSAASGGAFFSGRSGKHGQSPLGTGRKLQSSKAPRMHQDYY